MTGSNRARLSRVTTMESSLAVTSKAPEVRPIIWRIWTDSGRTSCLNPALCVTYRRRGSAVTESVGEAPLDPLQADRKIKRPTIMAD